MGTTEYVVLLVLAAVAVIAVVSKFGRTLGGNVDAARENVQTLGEDQSGRIAERSTFSGANAGAGSSSSPEALPEAAEKPSGARTKALGAGPVILIGIVGMAVLALMILAIAQRIRKEKTKGA